MQIQRKLNGANFSTDSTLQLLIDRLEREPGVASLTETLMWCALYLPHGVKPLTDHLSAELIKLLEKK